MQVAVANGMSGEQVAQMILQHNGLGDVPVKPAPGGPLSDHYDPRNRSVNLSQARLRGPFGRVRRDRRARGRARDPAPEGVRAVQGSQRPGAGRRVRVERLVLPAPDRHLRAISRASPPPRSFSSPRRALPARDAAGRVRRLAPRQAAAERARARHGGRVEGSEPGAQRCGADVRRGRVGRRHAAPLPHHLAANSGRPRCGL